MKPSSHWDPLVRDKATSPEPLENFRQSELGAHIDNANSAHGKIGWLEQRTKEAFEKLYPLINPELRFLVEESAVGRVRAFEMGGHLLSYASLEYAYMTSQIMKYSHCFRRVAEIGGGYGGLARAIMLALPPTHYTIIDFPAISRISRFFLKSFEWDSTTLRGVDWRDADTLPEDQAFNVSDDSKVDLFINTRSFGEMTQSQVDCYFRLMASGLRLGGRMYCVNRVKKLVRFCDYPIPRNWSIVYDGCWPLQSTMREVMFEVTS